MIQGSILSLHLQVAKGHTAVLPRVNSDPGSRQRATAVPLTPPAAAAAAPVAGHRSSTWVQNLESGLWFCQSSQRQPVAHSEIKIRVSFQFQLQFIVPSSTKEPPSNKQGGLKTASAMYCRKRGGVSPPRCPDFTADAFTAFTQQQSLADRRSRLPHLHLPDRYAQWKSNSPQLTWSKFPFFIPLCYQLYARRLPCLTPC